MPVQIKILYEGYSVYEAINKANSHILLFKHKLAYHGLHLNLEKTKLLIFNGKKIKVTNCEQLLINDYVLLPTLNVNFLGAIIDTEMCWKENVSTLSKKLNSSYFAIRQLVTCCDTSTVIDTYHALYASRLSYTILLWGHNNQLMANMMLLQKRVIRSILKLPYRASCRKHYIEQRIFTVAALYVFKCLVNIKKLNLTKACDMHNHFTRHRCKLVNETHNTTMYENSASYMGKKFFNLLNYKISELEEKAFCKTIKNNLIDNPMYSISEILDFLPLM